MPAPIQWTEELENAVIDWIASGKTLRSFGRQPGNPSHDAVYNREKVSDSFRQRIARAREIGYDAIAEECLEIMDDGRNDWEETELGPRVNPEVVNRSKLRVWGRLQLLAKWNPKKYGERITHDGEIGIKTVVIPQAAKDAAVRPERNPEFED